MFINFFKFFGLSFGVKKMALHCYLILALLIEAHNKKKYA